MKNTDDIPFDHVIKEPLLTEDGFINPLCMSELTAAINDMSLHRGFDEPEWTEKKFTSRKEIVGAFAMWACRQSPYGCPDGLETVCKYLNECLKLECEWNSLEIPWAYLSLNDINTMLHDILYEKNVKIFDSWNQCKAGSTPDMVFTTRYGTNDYNPDCDFIDLGALLRNVCVTIRNERREFEAFNKKFDEEHQFSKNGAREPTESV